MATILVLTSCPMEGCHVIIFISQNRNPNFPQTLAASINPHGSHRRFRPPRFCSDASPPTLAASSKHQFRHFTRSTPPSSRAERHREHTATNLQHFAGICATTIFAPCATASSSSSCSSHGKRRSKTRTATTSARYIRLNRRANLCSAHEPPHRTP